jgi:hypothetical protein
MVAGGGFEPPTFGLCDLTHLPMRVGLYLHPRGMLAIQSLRLPPPFRGLGSVLPYRSRDAADVKVVLHLFLLIEPEYAIVSGRCTSSARGAARIFGPDKLPHLSLTCVWAETSLSDWYPEVVIASQFRDQWGRKMHDCMGVSQYQCRSTVESPFSISRPAKRRRSHGKDYSEFGFSAHHAGVALGSPY